MGSLQFNSKDQTVVITADDGTVSTIARSVFDADPAAAVSAVGNGISPRVPDRVSASQARIALASLPGNSGATMLDDVEAVIAALPSTDPARIAWNYEHSFERTSPAINGLGAGIGLDAAALDDLFRAAAQINV